MPQEVVTIMGVGDITLDRENPKSMFSHTRDVLNSADITFAQLEQLYSDKLKRDAFVPARNRCDPENIPALSYAGLDIVSMAGNHACDWGTDALLDSIERLRKAGLHVIGAGANITEARRPAILERKGTRIAFLGYCSIGPTGYEADDRWPGFAPMRARTFYEQLDYQPGSPPVIHTFPYDEDLTAMMEDIRQAKAQADVVVLSIHWGVHHIPAVIPMYEFKVAHAAIDAGVDLILGHHAHILKGIEVYRGKAIFHNLGNFAHDTVIKQVLKEHQFDIRMPYMERTRNLYARGALPEAKHTIIAKVTIDQGEVQKVSFLPCHINSNREPEILAPSDPLSQQVVDYVQEISRNQGLNTEFAWNGNEVDVRLS